MILATIAILCSQDQSPNDWTDRFVIQVEKLFVRPNTLYSLAKELYADRLWIPNTWDKDHNPYIPNNYHPGDLERFPIATSPPPVISLDNGNKPLRDLYRKVLLDAQRTGKKVVVISGEKPKKSKG